ncbi:MAG: hypothetical protein QXL94_03170 [Candidatus Parvarchaeum sp.]
MVGKANALPYSQVSILDNVTQFSDLYSYSSVQYTITIYNTSASKFNISLPSNIKNLTVLNGLRFNVYPSSYCHTFSVSGGCILVGLDGIKEGVPINLRYEYYQNYSNMNDSFNSTLYFLPSSFTSSLTIKMLLPTGAYIPNGAYEVPSSVITTYGNRFEVSWDLINQSYPNISGYYINLPFEIEYNLTVKTKPPANYYIYYTLIPIILVIIIVSYFYFVKHKQKYPKKAKKKNDKRFALNLLNKDEKIVLSAISKKDFTYQSDLIKKTGFSKVKISKILSKLLRYRLLKIKQEGRINKVKRL